MYSTTLIKLLCIFLTITTTMAPTGLNKLCFNFLFQSFKGNYYETTTAKCEDNNKKFDFIYDEHDREIQIKRNELENLRKIFEKRRKLIEKRRYNYEALRRNFEKRRIEFEDVRKELETRRQQLEERSFELNAKRNRLEAIFKQGV